MTPKEQAHEVAEKLLRGWMDGNIVKLAEIEPAIEQAILDERKRCMRAACDWLALNSMRPATDTDGVARAVLGIP